MSDPRPSLDDPAAFRAWLLSRPEHAAAWVDELLSPADVAAQYPAIAGSVGTLANMRCGSRGPRYIKGPGCIYYRRLDCLAYLERQTVDPGA